MPAKCRSRFGFWWEKATEHHDPVFLFHFYGAAWRHRGIGLLSFLQRKVRGHDTVWLPWALLAESHHGDLKSRLQKGLCGSPGGPPLRPVLVSGGPSQNYSNDPRERGSQSHPRPAALKDSKTWEDPNRKRSGQGGCRDGGLRSSCHSAVHTLQCLFLCSSLRQHQEQHRLSHYGDEPPSVLRFHTGKCLFKGPRGLHVSISCQSTFQIRIHLSFNSFKYCCWVGFNLRVCVQIDKPLLLCH